MCGALLEGLNVTITAPRAAPAFEGNVKALKEYLGPGTH
jgi:hypothetical protein